MNRSEEIERIARRHMDENERLRARVAELERHIETETYPIEQHDSMVRDIEAERNEVRAEVEVLRGEREVLERHAHLFWAACADAVAQAEAKVEALRANESWWEAWQRRAQAAHPHCAALDDQQGDCQCGAGVERLRALTHESQAVAVQWSEKNDRLREALNDASMALGITRDVLECHAAPDSMVAPLNNHWCSQCDEYVDRNGNEREKIIRADDKARAALAGAQGETRREEAQAFFASMAPHEGPGGAFAGDERRALAERVREACVAAIDKAFLADDDVSAQEAIRALDLDAVLNNQENDK